MDMKTFANIRKEKIRCFTASDFYLFVFLVELLITIARIAKCSWIVPAESYFTWHGEQFLFPILALIYGVECERRYFYVRVNNRPTTALFFTGGLYRNMLYTLRNHAFDLEQYYSAIWWRKWAGCGFIALTCSLWGVATGFSTIVALIYGILCGLLPFVGSFLLYRHDLKLFNKSVICRPTARRFGHAVVKFIAVVAAMIILQSLQDGIVWLVRDGLIHAGVMQLRAGLDQDHSSIASAAVTVLGVLYGFDEWGEYRRHDIIRFLPMLIFFVMTVIGIFVG